MLVLTFLKTRCNLQAFDHKMGFIRAFLTEIWPFEFLEIYKKNSVIFSYSLVSKGLNNYPKHIILSRYGLKWENISVSVEKTPKVTEMRK